MNSLRFHSMATLGALVAACAMTTAPAAFAAGAHQEQQGLVQVAAAVHNYGTYFDHPGFKPIHVGH